MSIPINNALVSRVESYCRSAWEKQARLGQGPMNPTDRDELVAESTQYALLVLAGDYPEFAASPEHAVRICVWRAVRRLRKQSRTIAGGRLNPATKLRLSRKKMPAVKAPEFLPEAMMDEFIALVGESLEGPGCAKLRAVWNGLLNPGILWSGERMDAFTARELATASGIEDARELRDTVRSLKRQVERIART